MNFVDRIGDVVEQVRLAYDSEAEEPYYMYGHPLEIFNILSKKSESETFKYSKYPLIALFQDFQEKVNLSGTTVEDVTLVIMTETSPNYNATNRYTNTFTPTLIPIYDLLIKYLKQSNLVVSDDDYEHTKIDRLYWGTGDEFGNSLRIGNDALDAIVVSGLNLRVMDCNEASTVRITEDDRIRITEG